MHKKGASKDMQKRPYYEDVLEEVLDFFKSKVSYLIDLGFRENKIILDPGIGFGKTKEHNLILLKNLQVFKDLSYPILIGASMKRIIGDITGQDAPNRLAGTLGLHLGALQKGADILRVHHVRETKDMINCFTSVGNL